MSKSFASLFALPVMHAETVRPSDVAGMSAAAAADILCGKASAAARGQALARALVECAYGTPLVKSLLCANKRSSSARALAQVWPAMPVCTNSKSAPRLLAAEELAAAVATMAAAFDALASDKESAAAVKKAEKAVTVTAATDAAAVISASDAAATDAAAADLTKVLKALLAEALAVKALPKALKERITLALAA